jgi:hypothetical protein
MMKLEMIFKKQYLKFQILTPIRLPHKIKILLLRGLMTIKMIKMWSKSKMFILRTRTTNKFQFNKV